MTLADIRRAIDGVDDQILRLLEQRIALARQTRGLKPQPRDPAREAEVLRRIRSTARNPLLADSAERVFREIIAVTREAQEPDNG